MTPEFEWDAKKAKENLKKHGVAFEEALTVFADPLARIFDDPDHSENERRELIIGHSASQRLLVVSFTDREPRTRIIGAREATAQERSDYEQNTQKRTT
ncbi:MAG: BrnT family toxin [Acidobacteria bacterium]|nr:BrnT family toxin [Acidobacteriota bacterium]